MSRKLRVILLLGLCLGRPASATLGGGGGLGGIEGLLGGCLQQVLEAIQGQGAGQGGGGLTGLLAGCVGEALGAAGGEQQGNEAANQASPPSLPSRDRPSPEKESSPAPEIPEETIPVREGVSPRIYSAADRLLQSLTPVPSPPPAAPGLPRTVAAGSTSGERYLIESTLLGIQAAGRSLGVGREAIAESPSYGLGHRPR